MSDMRHDVKIRRVINKFGADGYAVYNFILEAITGNLTTESPLPEMEDCATDIADYLKMDTVRVEEIMLYSMQQGLFEQSETTGRIVCHTIYKFIDKSLTRSEEMRKMIENYKKADKINDCQELSQTKPDCLDRTEQNRTEVEQNRTDIYTVEIKEIITYLNSKTGKNFKHTNKKTISLITARLKDKYNVADFQRVINNKMNDKYFIKNPKYYNPETLFGNKFDKYLNERPLKKTEEENGSIKICPDCGQHYPKNENKCTLCGKTT